MSHFATGVMFETPILYIGLNMGKLARKFYTEHCRRQSAMLIAGDLINSAHGSSNIMKPEDPAPTAVEYELPEYPIQMTEERQKQERRVSVWASFLTAVQFTWVHYRSVILRPSAIRDVLEYVPVMYISDTNDRSDTLHNIGSV